VCLYVCENWGSFVCVRQMRRGQSLCGDDDSGRSDFAALACGRMLLEVALKRTVCLVACTSLRSGMIWTLICIAYAHGTAVGLRNEAQQRQYMSLLRKRYYAEGIAYQYVAATSR
jgi:hypothetical protein